MPLGPMLLTPGKPQTGPGWLVEPKLDGARALARVAGGEVTIQSRPGNSFTGRFPEVAEVLSRQFEGHTVIVDGELVALDAAGLPNFPLLQRRLHTYKPTALHQRTIPTRLWLFDCLHLDGRDLTAVPYRTRRATLLRWLRRGATSMRPRCSRSSPKSASRAPFPKGRIRSINPVGVAGTGSRALGVFAAVCCALGFTLAAPPPSAPSSWRATIRSPGICGMRERSRRASARSSAEISTRCSARCGLRVDGKR